MVKYGESDPPDPPEKDMKDFEFIQLCKFRVSETNNEISLNRSQLLAASSLYGLLFFATNDKGPGFKVVKTSELVAIDQSKDKERNKVTVTDFPVEAEVTLPGPIEFLSLSSDDVTLAVVLRDAGQLNILYFDVRSLSNKPSSVIPFTKSTFNIPNVSVVDIGWNPAQESMLAVCLSDGSMQMLEITVGTKVLASLPASVGASCFSWSPKGKQLLIGKKDGTLTQYEPGLKEKKHWPCPGIFSAPQAVVDVVWVSTYSFFASYLAVGAQASEQPIIVQTLSNKENNTKYINHEDPCFSNGEDVKPHFLFNFILKWDMVIMASSRASEATVIGKSLDDKVSWEHWNLDDCSRAELPLTASQNDSFPVGMAIDFSPQSKVVLTLPGGGSKVLLPCPILFLLTNDGILLSYHLSYTHKDAVEVTTIPKVLDTSSARRGAQGPAIQATPQGAMSSLTAPSAIQPAAPSKPASLATPFAAFSTPTTTAKPFPFGGAGTTSVGGFFAPGQKPPPPFGSSPSPFQTTQQTSSPFQTTQQTSSPFQTTQQTSSPFQTTQQTSSPFQSSQLSLSTPSSTAPAWSFSGTAPAAAVSKGQSSAFVSLNQPSTTTASGFAFDQSTLPRQSLSSTMQTKPPTVPALGAGGQPPAGSQLPAPAAGSMKTMGLFGSKSVQAQSEGVVTAAQPNQSVPGTTSFFSRPTQQPVRPPAPASMAPVAQHTPPANANVPAAFMGKPGMVAPPSYPSQPTDKGTPPQVNKDARTPGGSIPVEESKSAIKARVDIAFTHNIAEEIADFNLEISKLKSRNKQGGKPVGNRAEIATLRQDAEIMSNFLEEIKEATKDQTKECKDSKSACYNLLCMAEECNTLHQRNNDPHYHSLLQGRALDPVSAEKLKSLQQLAQSIEATVIDVDHVLDSQWADHLSKEKGRMTTSAGDTIYKSIKNNHWLIGDQRVRLEKLEEQIRSLKLRPKAKKFENENPFELLPQARRTPETKGSPSANSTMTPEKVSRLKDYLLQRKVPVVKSTTPSDLSMSRIAMQSAKKIASSARANVVSTTQLEASHPSTPQTRPAPASANQQFQQTPTGIPASQLRLPRGTLPDMSSLSVPQKPSIPFVSGISQPSPPQPAGPVAASDGASTGVGYGQPRGSPQIPTAFSGVAYFRPQQHHQPQAQAQAQSRPLVSAMGQGIPMGAQIPSEVQAAAQVLSKHMGSSMVPGGPLAHIPQLLSGGSVDKSSLKQPMEHFYEDITPTETDETNDDDEDDDYDEEDNGYEDEDEDEEEVAGQKSVFGQQLNVKPGGLSTQVQSVVKVASPPGSADATQDKKPPVFAPPKLSSGGPAPSFNFGQSSPTSSSGAAPSSTTTTTASSFFGGGAAIKPAFSFGGGGLFGQKASAGSGAGSVPVFGSVATPSKAVGFGDLATESGKPSETDAPPSGVQSKAGFTTTPSSGDNAPKDAPVFGKSKDAAATSSAPSSADVATKPTSSSVPVSTPPMTAFSFVSPSADASKPIADSTVGSMIGSHSKTSTKPDEIVNTSPFANQKAGTGFSIFGGNKAASPDGSKAGFDAVFSATSPTAATSSTTSGFSFAPNANNLSSPFGGSSNVFGVQSKVSETVAKVTDSGVNASGGSAANQISSSSSAAATATSQEKPPTSTITTTSTAFMAKGEMPTPTNLFSSSSLAAGSSPVTSISGASATLTQATSSTAATTTSSGFTFGNIGSATTATTTSSSLFGNLSLGSSTAPATTEIATLTSTSTSVPSLFGGSSSAQATPSATTASATTGFGAAATASTTAGFGALTAATTATTTTTSQASTIPVFGGGGGSSVGFSGPTTSGSLFGGAAVSSASSTVSGTTTPLFGSGSAVTAGSPAISSTAQVSAATSAAPSLFSGSSSFGSASVFGTPTTSTTSGGSLFGGAAATTAATSSIFGDGGTTSASSPFGFGTASKPSGGLFGSTSTATTSAGSGGPFSAPSGGGLFGNSSTTGSLFGASSSQGVSSSQTGSVFGQPEQTAGSMPFGQSQAGTGSLFGSGSGGFGLGGKPSEEKAKQNVFGSSSHTFGASNTESNSLFGSGGSSSFGTVGMASSTFDSNNAGGGGNGGFTSNRGTGVSATGFGVSASTNPSGFGSAPSFGATPGFSSPGFGSGFGGGNTNTGFGASPSFGVGASFGSSPAFAKSPGFGSTPSADSGGGFGSFASTSAPTFGQLAQTSSPGSSFGANEGGGGFGGGGQAMPSIFGSGGGDNNNAGGGSFGSFGASPGFGQAAPAAPAFGAAPSSGFGGSSFGSSPAFSSYRG